VLEAYVRILVGRHGHPAARDLLKGDRSDGQAPRFFPLALMCERGLGSFAPARTVRRLSIHSNRRCTSLEHVDGVDAVAALRPSQGDDLVRLRVGAGV